MAKKKKTRKELLKEPDEFLTFSSKMLLLAAEHKNQITYALGVIVLLVLVVSGIRFFSARAEKKAFALLDQSLAKYETLKDEETSGQAYQEVANDFQNIVNKYGNKKGGKLARMIFANICYRAGEFNKAIELYKTALNDFKENPMIHHQILSSLGYSYAQLNEDAKAASYFEKIAQDQLADSNLQGDALFQLGRLYEKLGEHEKSNEAFKKILSDHQDSIYIDLVKERLSG